MPQRSLLYLGDNRCRTQVSDEWNEADAAAVPENEIGSSDFMDLIVAPFDQHIGKKLLDQANGSRVIKSDDHVDTGESGE